jgi:hypothetical protein
MSGPAMAGGSPAKGFDRVSLQRELDRMRRTREIAFWICVGLVVLLFTGASTAAVVYRNDPAHLRTLSTATGVTLLGLVGLMVRLWEQKAKVDLVIALVSSMSEDALRSGLSSLVTKL